MKTLSNIASLLHLAAIAYLLLSRQLWSWSPWTIGPQVLALALAVWARACFPAGQFSTHPEPKAPRLIETGPYRWVRHPLYTASETVVWSGVLSHLSPLNLAIGAVTLTAAIVRIADEEALLRAQVPGYTEYARRTRRIVPFVF
jgi:protein-S-isoprenylcysteine O-methyltransferase Ste14